MAKIRTPKLHIPSAGSFVKAAMKTLCLESRTNGYLVHSLLAFIISILPSWLQFATFMNLNKSLRARYLKRTKKN
nr:hydroxysteroid 17-beta dehydrogenase 12 [Rousettus aegyptiacus]